MKMLLIRHGQTLDNVNGSIGTAVPGPGLTELGYRQAATLAANLASESIEAIYVSTLRRTRLTAQPLARSCGLEIHEVDGLQEITGGELEGLSGQEAISSYLRTIFSWKDNCAGRVPGGENGHEFFARFTAAIARIALQYNGTVAIFSHGAAIRTWASWGATNLDADFSRTHSLENTAVVVMEGTLTDGWEATFWAGEPVHSALQGTSALPSNDWVTREE